jgi:transcriptional regulator with XRE-family HTH domain
VTAARLFDMATRERPIDRGRRLARVDLLKIGGEIRDARHILGRSIAHVAAAAGLSPSQAGRIERAVLATASLDQLARLGSAVGLDVRVRAFAGPDPVRDAPQIALLARLQERLHPDLTLRTEVPLEIVGDQRAWDGCIGRLRDRQDRVCELPVEAETRLVDIQAQTRRITLKARDGGRDHVLLLVSDTHRNREAIRYAGPLLRELFPVSGRSVLRALAEGQHPGGSGILAL